MDAKTRIQIESNSKGDVLGVVFNISFSHPISRSSITDIVEEFQKLANQVAEDYTVQVEQLNS